MILAVLGDFKGEEAKIVINKILVRLQKLVPTSLSLAKYTTQLEVVSNLRNLHQETSNQINNMPVPFDFTITTAYKKGEAKTLVKNIEQLLRNKKLSAQEIADILEVSLDFVVDIQKKIV